MKYMLLIYLAENAITADEREACYGESTRLAHDLKASGKFISASPLHSVATARSVRVREGKRLVTDGPFAETHEALGGYYLIDAKDLDDAVEVAAKIPPARVGSIEVRPVRELSTK